MNNLPSSTAATLLAAANYLRTHGWTQGCNSDHDGRVCLLGAIVQSSTGDNGDAAIEAVAAELGVSVSTDCSTFDVRSIAVWNDAEGRTTAEVVDVLERAAGVCQ